MRQNILLNSHATIFVLLDKTPRKSRSSRRWAMMKLSPRSTGLKKSFLKNTEKLKVNILEKWHVSVSPIIRMERSATAVIHDCSNHHHYIAAYTNATQTELDTLSAGKIITKQFKADYPRVKKTTQTHR
jgi:hypothetical protein